MATATQLNVREQLEKCVHWLQCQNESLSFGIRTTSDALKLHSEWTANKSLPEFCDADYDDDGTDLGLMRKKILGYDPFGIVS